MQRSISAGGTVAVVGYGEVGKAFAARIEAAGKIVLRIDPINAGRDEEGHEVLAGLPSAQATPSLVLVCVPSAASRAVAREFASREEDFDLVDLTSSSQALMRECAGFFEGRSARFCDGAIMGSIDAAGADAPIALAGEAAEDVGAQLGQLGFSITVLPASKAGDASGLKLLRSLLTKSLEAVAIECFAAAQAMGLSDEIRENLRDFGDKPFPVILDSMVKTHVVHAPRRRHEIEAAIAQARDVGLDVAMSKAALAVYARTEKRIAAENPGTPSDAASAIAWLAEGYSA